MKLLAIDSNSILNRAFYGVHPLTNKEGQPTHAVYGFLTILLKMLQEVEPDFVAAAFDVSRKTFRNELFSDYKGTRKGMPDELRSQLPLVKEILADLGYKIVECEGFEADDILGTLAKACADTQNQCVVATGDRDSLQLVDEYVTVRLASTKAGRPETVLYDTAAVLEKYGVTPPQLIDVKALMGDTSDNIPGVAGIGEKTALSLIAQYHTLDGVYENLKEENFTKSVYAKLSAGKDAAYLSRILSEIKRDIPISTELSSYSVGKADKGAAANLFARLELFSLLEKFGLEKSDINLAAEAPAGKGIESPSCQVEVSPSAGELEKCCTAGEKLVLSFRGDRQHIKAMTIYCGEKLFYLKNEDGGCESAIDGILKSEAQKEVYDSKTLYRYGFERGFAVKNIVFDCSLAAYLLNPTASDYEPDRLFSEYGVSPMKNCEEPDIQTGYELKALCRILNEKLVENELASLLNDIELPLSRVLASMEHIGFAVDKNGITEFGKQLDSDIVRIQGEIYSLCGYEFNLNSPKQLGEALFERLGLPTKKKTKTGYSTNAEVLESLKNEHPIIPLILEHRQLAKLKSTYVEGLLKEIASDGRIHTVFKQTETRTGRISSTEPNLQNIPVRTPLGSNLRRYFVAKEGCVLADADYSQIELRVLAHIAGDENMIRAFLTGEDIHTNTASQVFDMPKELMTPLMRSRAKAVNFGIVYGIGAFSLSQDIHVSVAEADRYIKGYLNTYKGVKRYMEDSITFGKEHGYVKTLWGRRRYLPELAASNKITRAFGERVAMNTPIQGTAADIIKIAMIRVYDRLQKESLKSRLVLQVHDELIIECVKEEAEQVMRLLKEEMENAVQLKAPLRADVHTGENWYTAKG